MYPKLQRPGGCGSSQRKALQINLKGLVIEVTEIIGVRFKRTGKTYYFAPGSPAPEVGMQVIVETARGVECGEVVMGSRMVEDDKIIPPLKPIIRIATEKDLKIVEQNRAKEQTAAKICQEKIAAHKLDMKLVDVECTFDNNKLLFYFTADNRVDFRELVKDLAAVFRTRIELRQIGVRDEAKMLGLSLIHISEPTRPY